MLSLIVESRNTLTECTPLTCDVVPSLDVVLSSSCGGWWRGSCWIDSISRFVSNSLIVASGTCAFVGSKCAYMPS